MNGPETFANIVTVFGSLSSIAIMLVARHQQKRERAGCVQITIRDARGRQAWLSARSTQAAEELRRIIDRVLVESR